ncbi:hypothetical protein G7B40_040000 [Aetokthonos hydrillicola Thurmond2011]|jgi:hypothetical protein|uniref:DUF4407 domain-containing protein n=1 Tax=Aetokthonos hydrillicola Thurmond2011 TaxID=2712845 RepID=A0AAP5IG31_9CYAN|nr:hypothetical protein [Aetokthonos hydrillicola]MBW4590094.1 hypothetical protein [Aetokthonos hydrillicola CCALA 1050]MDR9900674.1 hypothetical protein [Aetokthonos hydrillicola Thurmond2011]
MNDNKQHHNHKVPPSVSIDRISRGSSNQLKQGDERRYNFQDTIFSRFWQERNPFRMVTDQEWQQKKAVDDKRKKERRQWWSSIFPGILSFLYNAILFAGGVAWKSPHLKKDANLGRLARGGIVLVLAALQATVFAFIIGYISHLIGFAVFIWVIVFYYFLSLEQSIQSRRKRSIGVVLARVLPAILINLASAFFAPVLFSQESIKEEATKNLDYRLAKIEDELSILGTKRFRVDGDVYRRTGIKKSQEVKAVTAQIDALNAEKQTLLEEKKHVWYGSFAAHSLSFDKQLEYVWQKTFPSALNEALADSWIRYQIDTLKYPSKKQSISEAEQRRYDAAIKLVDGKYAHQASHLTWFLLFFGFELAPVLLWLADGGEKEGYAERLNKIEDQRAHEAAIDCFSDTDFEKVERQAQKAPQYADYCEIIARETARARRANEKYAEKTTTPVSSSVVETDKIRDVSGEEKRSAVPPSREETDDVWGDSVAKPVNTPDITPHKENTDELPSVTTATSSAPPNLIGTNDAREVEEQESFSLENILEEEWRKEKEKRRNRRNF